jgi:hypothetical protein
MDDRTCSEGGCDRPHVARGMCNLHYLRWKNALKDAGLPLPPAPPLPARTVPQPCAIDGCGGVAVKRGWCETHYTRWRRTGSPGDGIAVRQTLGPPVPRIPGARCAVDGCGKPARHRGWCSAHYERWRRTGDTQAAVPLKPLVQHGPAAVCAVAGCGKPLSKGARGWCRLHYDRWRKYGDPLHARKLIGDDEAALEANIDRSGGPDACHPWTGRQGNDGYGWAKKDGRPKLAHIAAWEFKNGPRPKGSELDHECHNQAIRDDRCLPGKCPHRLCCNLRHIVLRASKSEHAAATPGVAKRRHGRLGKLTEAQVRELRELLKDAKGYQLDEIGERYGIRRSQAYRIKRGHAWRWLPDVA